MAKEIWKRIQAWAGAAQDGIPGDRTALAIAAKAGLLKPTAFTTTLTEPMLLEIMEHEAIVPEAYKDSEGIWTWGVGVTNASGHDISRYKDNPVSVLRCLEIYEWLLRTKYLPAVLKAFEGVPLKEHELAAALSFHWNTGAIGEATWVSEFKAGEREKARLSFLNWRRPPNIIGRRKCERDLFFDGKWTYDGFVTLYDVAKPSYAPKWSSARQVDIREALREVMKRAGA